MLYSIRALGLSLTGFALLTVMSPTTALAKCGTGNPASYGDIDAIMLGQNYVNGQGPTLIHYTTPTFARSTFWAFFWNNGREELPTVYSQFSQKGMVGTFNLSATLEEAQDVLQRHRFFELSPPDDWITDTPQTVLYVKRCAVITTIRTYVIPQKGEDGATRALFDDLRSLILNAKMTRTSPTPRDFEQTGLFNP